MVKKKHPRILVFIPMYNCEVQISRVLNQFSSSIAEYVDEVIIVNNISTDKSEATAIDFIKNSDIPVNISVLRNRENYGLGGSHKVAFQYAITHEYDYVVVLHGDDQGSINDLIPVLESGAYQNYDCCLGARFMRGSILPGYSAFRTFGNKVYNFLFSIACGRKIYDLGSGLNLYHTAMLYNQFYTKFPDDLTFNYCMVLALAFYKQSALFFPLSWREDDQVSNVKLFSQAKRVLGLLLSYILSHKKFMAKELRQTPKEKYSASIVFTTVEN